MPHRKALASISYMLQFFSVELMDLLANSKGFDGHHCHLFALNRIDENPPKFCEVNMILSQSEYNHEIFVDNFY